MKYARGRLSEVFLTALKLGLTSFGGPIAHIGYFQTEYVQRKKWLSADSFADLVALCQFLPGPASSQLGIAIGTLRAGIAGGLLAWLGFTLPSALLLGGFALIAGEFGQDLGPVVHGLKIVALVVVFQAILSMWQGLIRNTKAASLALFGSAMLVLFDSAFAQLSVMALAAVFGAFFLKSNSEPREAFVLPYGRIFGAGCLALCVLLLAILPVLSALNDNRLLDIADSFYRSGALVFGGGHVVLPLLEKETVATGWIGKDMFLAGYGAAQAIPGPLFTFSAFLGTVSSGLPGGILGLIAIFFPAYLLVIGSLPFWNIARNKRMLAGALNGVNAAVVGLLIAVFLSEIWPSAVTRSADLVLGIVLLCMNRFWKVPTSFVALAGIAGGYLLSIISI